MKRISTFLISAVSFFGFYSCVDLDVDLENFADAYIASKIINGDTVFALEAYAQSNYNMKSVSLKSPDNSEPEIDLVQIDYGGGIFEKKTDDANFIATKPKAGNYTFNINYLEQTPMVEIDKLSDSIIYPTTISEIILDSLENVVTVKWTKVKNADAYILKVIENENYVFISSKIAPEAISATFSINSYGWLNQYQPVRGKEYQFMISAVLYEESNIKYNEIQGVSHSEKVKAIWPN